MKKLVVVDVLLWFSAGIRRAAFIFWMDFIGFSFAEMVPKVCLEMFTLCDITEGNDVSPVFARVVAASCRRQRKTLFHCFIENSPKNCAILKKNSFIFLFR